MSSIVVPSFTTDRLIIRPPQLSDSDAYQRYFADWQVIRSLSIHVPWPYPENGAELFLKNKVLPHQGDGRWCWIIAEQARPDEAIGSISIWREGIPEHRGFWLARQHWGKGYMVEALEPVNDFAFGELGFEKMVYSNAVGNLNSRRIKEKMGARFLYAEPAEFHDSEFTHHELWEMTAADWWRQKTNAGRCD